MYRRCGFATAPIHTQNELKQSLQSGLEILLFFQQLEINTTFVIPILNLKQVNHENFVIFTFKINFR
jgi:hypothetical protein